MAEYNSWKMYSSPPPPQKKKELLVFAVYINMGNISASKGRLKFDQIRSVIKETFADVENQTNYLIKFLFFPVREQETKIVCVFPKTELSGFSKEMIDEIKDAIGMSNFDIETLLDSSEDDEDIEEGDWFDDSSDGSNGSKGNAVDDVQQWKTDYLNTFMRTLNG